MKMYEGKKIQYTNNSGSAISAGDVVVLNATLGRIGIAAVDIADGESGTVAVQGIFSATVAAGSADVAIGDSFKLAASTGAPSILDTASTGTPDVTIINAYVASNADAGSEVLIRIF